MSSLPIVASCEVLLSDDVLRDLFTRGTNFKRRELAVARGGDPPGASSECGGGDGAGDRDRPSPVAALQFFSVQLEKQSDAVIKLFISVFKADSTDQQQQTDLPATVSDKSVQGDHSTVSVAATQTDILNIRDSGVQTKERRLRQTFRNTYCLTEFNMSTQKDGAMMATAESKASHCQTVSNAVDVSIQTARNDVTASIQTDPPPTEDSVTQTDPPSISQVKVQTQSSMARESDAQMQASVETGETFMQTDLIQTEADAQTDISIARRSDGEVQACAETVAKPTQTDVKVGDGASQTESSMLSQRDSESQCAADVSELSCQTELQIEHNSSQTTSSLSLETERETQTATDLSDGFSQTDVDEAAKTEQESQMFSQESTASADAGNDSVNTSQDLFTEIINREGVTPRKRCGSDALRDNVAQTDPVTIIIGDASFLVKKLKSSAVSPSKITTSGNEIEIELSAEVAGSDAPFGAEEKENNLQRYAASHPESFLPRSGPMIRGGTPGVVARGIGGGVRVRMPTTMQSPVMTRVPASRTQPGAQVRFQSPTVLRAPGPAAMPRHGGRNSTGGTFSCPFCSLIFIDSPALYEHLSVNHQVDQKTKWKQPKGREGKTIIPRKQKNPENNPPVLTPIKPLGMQTHSAQYAIPDAGNENTEDEEGEDAHEAGLFEDPVETSAVKRRRGRPRTRGSDLDVSVSDDDIQTSGKRQRKEHDGGASKRARVEEQWEETEEADEDEEEEVVVKTSRRGGRTPRTRTK